MAPLPGVLLALGFEPAGHDSGGDPIGGRFLEIGPGLAIPSGDINATVLNYAALKFFKSSISTANVQPAMEAAREFILAAGGIDATNQFTKTFLALFGLRGWEDLSEIPYLIFLEVLPLNYRQFSQWVIPHLIPMACLRHNRVSPKIRGTFGPELDLGELYAGQSWQSHEKENEPSALGRPLGHQHALWHHPGRNGASAGRRIAAIALSPHSRSDADEFSKSRWRLQQRKCMSNMGHCASD